MLISVFFIFFAKVQRIIENLSTLPRLLYILGGIGHPRLTPAPYQGTSKVTNIIHPKSKENEESKDNLAPTDGSGKLLAEGTRQTKRKNPERGHSLTD